MMIALDQQEEDFSIRQDYRGDDPSSIVESSFNSKTNAELVICSLNLLGFNPDDYIIEYTYYYGYSYGLMHLTSKTFEKQNEKTLLIILHFLLTRPLKHLLNQNDFQMPSLECWPYHDAKEKNDFKSVLQLCLSHLVEINQLSVCFLKAAASIINTAKGSGTWALLRALSDIALKQALVHYYSDKETLLFSEQKLSQKVSTEISESIILSKDELTLKVKNELSDIYNLVDIYCTNQKNQMIYFAELETRFKNSLKNTVELENNMKKVLSDSRADILSENGKLVRVAIVEKLNRSILQLQSLSESTIFIKTQELLAKEKFHTFSNKNASFTAEGKRWTRRKDSRVLRSPTFALASPPTSPKASSNPLLTTRVSSSAVGESPAASSASKRSSFSPPPPLPLLWEPTPVTVTCESDRIPVPLTVSDAERNNRVFLEAIKSLVEQVDELGKHLSQ